ncbi:class I SAM-dependent methyltransferase [Paenibacillus sp. NPDC056579]|uniref:class I SAM-dependent methyltransferase n=1 Tax=Paenibacillus sp. NPDC056579 TaxID=3345871 RepID=UPI0036B909C1
MSNASQTVRKSPSQFWIQAWEQASGADLRVGSDLEEEKYWRENAAAYDERNPLAPYTQPIMDKVFQHLQPDDHLLEIGPGTGGFTRLLGPHVREVTLIEPSAAMYEVLCSSWDQGDKPLPKALIAKWEEAPEVTADIVFGANAFYRIRDMKSSLLKMHQTARRHVFLIQSIGRPFAGPLHAVDNGEWVDKERAEVLSGILDELNIRHRYDTFPIQRKNGMIHDVALIHWSNLQSE